MPDAQIGFQASGLTREQWLSIVMIGIGMILLRIWSGLNAPKLGGWAVGNIIARETCLNCSGQFATP